MLNRALTRHVNATFVVFLAVHVTAWTLLPLLTRHELDGDSMMHYGWSQSAQWSYSLHPPLLPWVISIWLNAAGTTKLSYILLSQVNLVVVFLMVWMLAREFLPPIKALLAVCLLELIPYYSHLGIRLNHSSLLISCWAVTTLFVYYSLTRNRLVYWISAGVFAAFAMLAKYYSVALIGAIGFLLLFTRIGRSALKGPGPYVAMAVFLAIMAVQVNYVLGSGIGTIRHVGDYFYFDSILARLSSIRFAASQIGYLSPLLLIFCLVLARRPLARVLKPVKELVSVPTTDRVLILYVLMFFPFLVTVIPGFVLGVEMSSRWGGPLWSSIGILLLVQTSATLRRAHYRTFFMIIFGFMIVAFPVMLAAAALGVHGDRYTYPGREIGEEITRRWHVEFDRDLKIVGGGFMTPGSLAFNSPDHPYAFQYMSFEQNPWITPEDIEEHGMAVVCRAERQSCIDRALELYPDAEFEDLAIDGKRSTFSSYRTQMIRYFFVPPGQENAAEDGPDRFAP